MPVYEYYKSTTRQILENLKRRRMRSNVFDRIWISEANSAVEPCSSTSLYCFHWLTSCTYYTVSLHCSFRISLWNTPDNTTSARGDKDEQMDRLNVRPNESSWSLVTQNMTTCCATMLRAGDFTRGFFSVLCCSVSQTLMTIVQSQQRRPKKNERTVSVCDLGCFPRI